MTFIVYGIAALLLVGLAYFIIFILREYERGVIFFLGRFQSVMGPGIIFLIPGVQQLVRVDLRTRVLDVPTQDVISRDNVSVKVNAVIYFRVVDPEKAIVQVEDFHGATSQLAQTTLRYLQTMLDISTEKSSTILFPVPIDLLAAFKDYLEQAKTRDA